MNRPEPIELENNLGPDAVTGEINRVPWMAYDVDEMDIYIAEKDKEIAELKEFAENACLERDDNQNAIDELQAENAELKRKLEDVQASAYADMVDAGMRERRLRRALWLARAERAKTIAKIYSKEAELILLREHYPSGCGFCHIMNNKWKNVERKCRAKAELYK